MRVPMSMRFSSNAIASVTLLSCLLFGTVAWAAQTDGAAKDSTPIIFVHGNGDDAAKWVPTMWLFESNGYPADRLFAIRFTHPVARTDDTVEEPFRSSTIDAVSELSAFVTRVLVATHSRQVVLVGSSRGGMTIRNYLQNGGGRANVSAAILCGTPNHGVLISDTNLNGEFNGKGAFLMGLNRPAADGSETVSGVRMLTLRSDKLDKFAQPTAVALGRPETSTGITFDGPALKGATNVVLPGEDHRELAFSRDAFAAMYHFITGRAAQSRDVTAEARPSLSGVITGYAGQAPTNQPVARVHMRIYPIRAGSIADAKPVYEGTTADDGRWGPFVAEPRTEYEFDLECNSQCSPSPESTGEGRHIRYFVAALPRSTRLLNLRLLPAPKETASGDGKGASKVLIERPQGYFSRERDPVLLDGKVIESEPVGLPIRDSFSVEIPEGRSTVAISLRQESVIIPMASSVGSDLTIAYFLW